MEHQNNPEKLRPMFNKCAGCDRKYQLTGYNSVVFNYAKQEIAYVFCACKKCGASAKLFCDADTVKASKAHGIEVIEDDWTDDETYQQWLEVRGIELPEEYELTDRHERLIEKLGQTLTNMPDEMILDELSDPAPPQTMPNKWA